MIKLQGKSRIIAYDEKVTACRECRVIYVDGKPVKKDLESFEVICNVQPLNGRELLLVPEGDRDLEQYNLFAEKLQFPLMVNDRIIRQGVNYQVQIIEDWGSFIKVRIVKNDVGPTSIDQPAE